MKYRYYLVLSLAFSMFFISLPVIALNILFINPSDVGQPHWDKAQKIAEIAAEQLQIKLLLARRNSKRKSNIYLLKEALKNKQHPPQAVIFMLSPHDNNHYLFSLLEDLKLPFITLENSFDQRETELLGVPGSKYKYWLAHKSFDDKQAGYLLAQQLIAEASARFSPPISLVAISGAHIKISELRNSGLQQSITENPQVTFKQLVYNKWNKERSRIQTIKLMIRHPETKIIWAASDIAALGAYQALIELGKTPGKDVIIGGIDWQKDVFPLMQQGHYNVSVGGQVLAATSALMYLYDYFNGVNKQLLQNMPNLNIDIATTKDLKLLDIIQQADIEKINFKLMSIKHNNNAALTAIKLSELLSTSVQ